MNFDTDKKYIAVCICKIHEDFQETLIHSVIKRAVSLGYKVIIYNSSADLFLNNHYDIGESKIYDIIPYHLLDGLIILSETIKNENILNNIIQKARQNNVFTVSIDKHMDSCFNIEFNYTAAFDKIVRHVIEKHGCKTINLVAGMKDNSFSNERILACKKVMNEFGLALDPNRIMYGDFWSVPTEKAFDEFMRTGMEMPDAFICCNDSMAITVCAKLKEYGFHVPDDVIVTGFDGITQEKYHIPRLTTAKQNTELAGITAVDAIYDHICGKETSSSAFINHSVVVSQSCGCKPRDFYEFTDQQLTPLFMLTDSDITFDTFMYDFTTAAAATENLADLAEKISYFSSNYGWYYYGLCLNKNFMNITDDYENFIDLQSDSDFNSNNTHLIIAETFNDNHYPPYFSDKLDHLNKACDKYNVFLFWPLHFQEMHVGYGVSALSTGCDGITQNSNFRHVIKYTRNLNHVLEIANSQSVLKKVIAKLQDLYIRDQTGLYNRRGFYNEINKMISKAKKEKDVQSYLIIISVDMDGLKSINDTHGHAEGDVAIKAIADALISVWSTHEICSRFGGDEFTVASICSSSPSENANTLTEKIRTYINNFNQNSNKPYTVCASFGVHYQLINDDLDLDLLIKTADDSMYKEKSTHKTSRYRNNRS